MAKLNDPFNTIYGKGSMNKEQSAKFMPIFHHPEKIIKVRPDKEKWRVFKMLLKQQKITLRQFFLDSMTQYLWTHFSQLSTSDKDKIYNIKDY
jgi:hypothetical protein